MPRPNFFITPVRVAAALVVFSSFLVSPLAAGLWRSAAAGGADQKIKPASRRPSPDRGDGGDAASFADQKNAAKPGAEFVPGEALVRFRSEAKAAGVEASGARLELGDDVGGTPVQISSFEGSELVPGLRLARFEAADTLAAVAALAERADVLYAEPNYVWRAQAVPNDPRFASNELYGLTKIGAPSAWDTTQGGQSVVVAVIDEGIDFAHPDLAANAWTNPGETGTDAQGNSKASNGIDDDGNGRIDDTNGWDFYHNDKTVYDGPVDDHGTHVAGTIGARGNIGVGVAGVNWQVGLMSVKVLGPGGGFTSDIIAGYNYVRQMRQLWVTTGGARGANVRVTNNSYGGPGFSQAALDAINQLNAEGILVVVAAGNDARDNFNYPYYPAGYSAPNLIAVASTTSSDTLSSFSNFSSRMVGMGAPGSSILSTTPNNTYSTFSGTSMATPHVAGAAALLLSAAPDISVANLRGALAFTGDRLAALDGKTTTGRRLNARAALDAALEADSAAPAQTTLSAASQTGRSLTLSFAAPGDDGFAGTAADYDFYFNPSTGQRILLPSSDQPAAGGTQQQVSVNVPYRSLSGTVEIVAYDNRGNASTSSLAVNLQQNAGTDPYVVAQSAAEQLSTGGTRITFDGGSAEGDDKYRTNLALPFAFPFYGQQRTQVTVSTNGSLYFSTPPRRSSSSGDPNEVAGDFFSFVSALQGQSMIAGLWDDLDLRTCFRPDAGLYQITESNRVVFRWQGISFLSSDCLASPTGNPINFEIELRPDGTIIFRYGSGNQNMLPVVGVSGGEPSAYDVASHTSESSPKNLTNAQTVTFAPREAPQSCGSTPINFGQTFAAALAAGDCEHPGNGSFYDAYTFTGTAGQLVTVRMLSPAPGQSGGFDTYLYLLRPGETTPGPGSIQNDDGPGSGSTDTLDSAIVAVLPQTGTYTILANSAQANQTGSYTVELRGCAAALPAAANAPAAGALAAGDCQLPDGTFADAYSFDAVAGQQIAVEMRRMGGTVDPILSLLSTDGFTRLASDDDGFDTSNPANLDARIPPNSGLITLPAAGTYYVLAGSFNPGETGGYLLTVFTPELSVAMTASPAAVPIGGDITYDITVTNAGPPSAGVTLTDNLPAGVQLVSASPSQGSCTGGAPTVTCNLGGMAAGATATARIVVRAVTAGSKLNSVSVAAVEAERDTSNNTAQQTTQVTAAITGRVLTAGTNAPLGGVTVTLSGSQSGTTQTDANGNYSFAGLAAGGNYTVTPSLAGYTFAPTSATFNNLSANQVADFTGTPPSFSISGRVINTSNTGLGGVTLTLSGSLAATTQTDPSGNYSFTNLSGGGNYTVSPSLVNYTFAPPSRTFPDLSANQTGDFVGTLNTHTISGRVADAANAPIPEVTITLSGSASRTTQTDAQGNYSFAGLVAGGTYTLTPSKVNFTFDPQSRTLANLGGDQAANFTAMSVPASIQFDASAYAAGESGPSATITVTRTINTSTPVSVNYSTANGTATAGSDYSAASGTLNFAANEPSKTFTITIIDDARVEGAETVLLQLSGASANAALGNPASAVLTIQENDSCSFVVTGDLPQFAAAGGQGTVTMNAPEGCSWTASSLVPWLTITAGASGSGAGTISFTVAPNAGPARTGSILHTDDSFYNVSQASGCTYSIAPQSQAVTAAGGNVTVNVTASDSACAWTAASSSDFITVSSGAAGNGNGAVTVSVAPNPSSIQRSGTLTIAGQTFTVTQAGAPCQYSVSPNGLAQFPAAGGQGSFQMIAPQGCAWLASSLAPWITITAGATGSGNGTVTFTVAQNLGPVRHGQILRTDDSFFTVSQAAGGSAFAYGGATNFQPGEGGARAQISIVRFGDVSRAASVTFQTVDDPEAVPCATVNGKAYARCDYATTVETLTWAAGDDQPKTVTIPLIDDSRVEGAETFQIRLTDPQDGIVDGSGASTITLQDNDAAEGPNPISGNRFFVRMQYLDFLSREPEQGEPWTKVLDDCPNVDNTDPNSASAGCDRILVSSAFFQSPEFALKGFYAFLFYRVAFDRRPEYSEIVLDMRNVTGQTPEEVFAKRAQLAVSFTQRAEFRSRYDGLGNGQYVAALLGRYGLQQITTEDPQQPDGTAQVALSAQQLTDALDAGSLTRAQVLRAVVQSSEVDAAEFHGAFVAMQYYGYLRRTPEEDGYQAWLRVIRQDPNNIRIMVHGFVNSVEYRLRFGSR
jgi:uncharacterized repeat protein (TIGR01451 family)